MTNGLSPQTANWICQALGPGVQIQSAQPLAGATSSTLFLLHLQDNTEVVLRLFTNQAWLAEAPHIARQEADNLRVAVSAGLVAPQVLAWDETGDQAGVPAILMTRVPGRVDLHPADTTAWLRQLAEALAQVHAAPAPDHPWQYFAYQDPGALPLPDWTPHQDLWRTAMAAAGKPRPAFQARLIHRDYHPVNVLWIDDRLSGIVDWPNACIGPVGVDLGHCRLNLATLYGVEAADQFLEAYRAAAGSAFAYDPYWDLVSVMDMMPGPPAVYQGWVDYGVTHLTPKLMAERLDRYVASVVRRL